MTDVPHYLASVDVPPEACELRDQLGAAWVRKLPTPDSVSVPLRTADLAYLARGHADVARQMQSAGGPADAVSYHLIEAEKLRFMAEMLGAEPHRLQTLISSYRAVLGETGLDQHGQQWLPKRSAARVATHLAIEECLDLRRSYEAAAVEAMARADYGWWNLVERRRAELLLLAAQIDPDRAAQHDDTSCWRC